MGSRRRVVEVFFRRRLVPWPTPAGWALLVAALGLPFGIWIVWGESMLSATRPAPGARVLIVEGWIGTEGVRAAAGVWRRGGYAFVIAAGGSTSSRWTTERWSYAEIAAKELSKAGIPAANTRTAASTSPGRERTRESARAAARVLAQLPDHVRSSVDVFTMGPHAARSRVVYERTLGPGTRVGIIAWRPPEDTGVPWWTSSERAKDFLIETFGLFNEVLVNSWRRSSYEPAR